MKLQARPAQVRVHSFRLDPDHWVRFQVLAQKRGWQASGALRQLVRQFAAEPFPLEEVRHIGGEARTGWFECDADAVEKLQTAADRAGIKLNDALRQLVGATLRAERHR